MNLLNVPELEERRSRSMCACICCCCSIICLHNEDIFRADRAVGHLKASQKAQNPGIHPIKII